MNLKDIKFLSQIAEEREIKKKTLYRKFERMILSGELIEFQDYKKFGERNPVILSKEGAEKLINKN